jgi:hypothetical protein
MNNLSYEDRKKQTIEREYENEDRIRLDECVNDLPVSEDMHRLIRILIGDALSIGYDNGYGDAQQSIDLP